MILEEKALLLSCQGRRAYVLEERLKFYCQPKLLIVDEIGYIPIDRHGAHLFFQLVSRRYEKGALILTSNRSFSQWNEISGDPLDYHVHLGQDPAPLDHDQHQRQLLPSQGKGQGRAHP